MVEYISQSHTHFRSVKRFTHLAKATQRECGLPRALRGSTVLTASV